MRIKDKKIGKADAFMRIYQHEDLAAIGYKGMTFPGKRRAVLIIPGGGYNHISEREAEPVAIHFFNKGYECAVLYYSVGENIEKSNPLMEASQALMELRELERVDNCSVAAIGFSAGGHLASMLAAHGKEYCKEAELNALILAYPVISMGSVTHKGSHDLICPDLSKEDYFSAEKSVDATFPPTFIWATRNDETVNVKNSLMMYESLINNGIYSELHIYPDGVHGLSLSTIETGRVNPYVSRWIDEVYLFLDTVFRNK